MNSRGYVNIRGRDVDFNQGCQFKENREFPEIPGGHGKIEWKSRGGQFKKKSISSQHEGLSFFLEKPNESENL